MDVITIIVLILLGLLFAAVGVPNLLKATNIKIYFPSPIIRLLVFISFLSIGLIPAYLLMLFNRALLRLEKRAYKFQIILSMVLLVGFPVFTALYGLCLFFLNRPNVKKQLV